MSSIDYFQCLVCNTYFNTLAKIEKHTIQRHKSDNGRVRGRLPIQKVSFAECFIPIVRNQIDPNFLKQYETVVSKGDSPQRLDKSSNPSVINCLGRPLRKSRVRATQKIREVVREVQIIPGVDDDDGNFSGDERESINFESEDDDDEDNCLEEFTIQKAAGKRSKSKQSTRVSSRKQPRQKTKGGAIKCSPSEARLKSQSNPVETIPCPVHDCKFLSTTYTNLRRHLTTHCLAEKNELDPDSVKDWDEKNQEKFKDFFTCKFCLTSCKSLKNLTAHLEHHKMKPCTLCLEGNSKIEPKLSEYLAHVIRSHMDALDPFGEREKIKIVQQKSRVKTGKRFECEICHKKFWDNYVMQRHILKIHEMGEKEEDLKPFVCPVCGKGFRAKLNLRGHLNLHSDNNPWVCDFPKCGKKFTRKPDLRRHKILHVDGDLVREQNKCPICPSTFSEKYKIRRHLFTIHKISPDSDLTNLKDHKYNPLMIRSAHRYVQKISRTTMASVAKPSKNNNNQEIVTPKLEVLEEVHYTDKIYINPDGSEIHEKGKTLKRDPDAGHATGCTESNKINSMKQEEFNEKCLKDPKFAEVFLRNIPSKGVGTLEPFQCSQCGDTFSRAWTLHLHLTSTHKKTIMDQMSNSESKLMLMCGTCAYPAKDKKDLESHIKSKHKKANYKRCEKCGLLFDSLKKLQNHQQRIHFGKRNYCCKVCKKRFVTKASLQSHKRSHEDRKACHICLKMYTSKSLYHHLRRHELQRKKMNGEKIDSIYKCRLCKDDFATTTSLQRHIDAIHLGKPINKPNFSKNTYQTSKKQESWLSNVMIELGLSTSETNKLIKNSNPDKCHEEPELQEKNDVKSPAAVECDDSVSIFGI